MASRAQASRGRDRAHLRGDLDVEDQHGGDAPGLVLGRDPGRVVDVDVHRREPASVRAACSIPGAIIYCAE
jgi:hypothetical protein